MQIVLTKYKERVENERASKREIMKENDIIKKRERDKDTNKERERDKMKEKESR